MTVTHWGFACHTRMHISTLPLNSTTEKRITITALLWPSKIWMVEPLRLSNALIEPSMEAENTQLGPMHRAVTLRS